MRCSRFIFLFYFLLEFFSFELHAQNIVSNPGFEIFTTCPTAFGQINRASPWYSPTTGGSTDLFHSCSANIPVPITHPLIVYQQERNGTNGIMGLQVHSGSANYREYAQAPLNCSLDSGVTYYVEMYVNKSNTAKYAIDQIGIFFSVNPLTATGSSPLLVTPQIVSPSGTYITDTLNWTLISGTFMADSAYSYITIGNFKNDANTNLVDPLHGAATQCYYLFDDIFITRNIAVSGNPTICAGQTASLSVNGNGPYNWSPATGLSATSGNTVIVNPIITTTYSAYDQCSQTTKTFTVTVNPSPTVAVTGTSPICEGSIATLTTSGGGSYSWSTGASTATISVTPSLTTMYTVTVSNGQCFTIDSLRIIVTTVPVANAGVDDTICSGQTATLSVSGSATGGYVWNTGITSQSINVSPIINTVYSVTVSNGSCIDIDSVIVISNTSPTAIASGSTTILQGQGAVLSSSGGSTYHWSPSTGLSCNTCQYPLASPQYTTTYCVLATDTNGCSDTACVTINVSEIICGELFVPNAFSPNNDGENEEECIFNACIKKIYFVIYDRWGEEVFATTDPNECWNGMYKGTIMNSAVFTYYMEAITIQNESITKKGNITLIR